MVKGGIERKIRKSGMQVTLGRMTCNYICAVIGAYVYEQLERESVVGTRKGEGGEVEGEGTGWPSGASILRSLGEERAEWKT